MPLHCVGTSYLIRDGADGVDPVLTKASSSPERSRSKTPGHEVRSMLSTRICWQLRYCASCSFAFVPFLSACPVQSFNLCKPSANYILRKRDKLDILSLTHKAVADELETP